MADDVITMFLCGDVMLGRGIDQVLPHPGNPTLWESHIRDARDYVELAERVNGPIPRPVDVDWPWGDALQVLFAASPDARIINLETSVTRSADIAAGKRVHYRMEPDNLPSLTVARPDVCVLANNHVLDFGRSGLAETLDALSDAGLPVAGAGYDIVAAGAPARVPVSGDDGQVLVFGVGAATSGIPDGWAATDDRSGVWFVGEPSATTAAGVIARIEQHRRRGDVVVVSIHWGSNWGYGVPHRMVEFAHALVDGGVDVVHGHSSHHPRPIEVYRDRLILYGCGDFINDYEGITGHETYRGDLRLAYLASVSRATGALVGLRMVPLQARRLRLDRATRDDAGWLQHTLDRISRPFGSAVHLEPNEDLVVTPDRSGSRPGPTPAPAPRR